MNRRRVGGLLVAAILIFGAVSAWAATIYDVYPGLGTPIQDAITGASPGDTIKIHPGTYTELITVMTPNLTIRGTNRKTVKIDVSRLGSGANNAGIYVGAADTTLKNFTLYGSNDSRDPRYGLKIGAVDGCYLKKITVKNIYKTGFDFLGTSNLTVTNVLSQDNGGHGMQLCDCNGVTLSEITTEGSGWQSVSVCTWGRYSTLGTSGIKFTGTNSFEGVLQIEEGDFNNPGVPPSGAASITYSTNPADGADVTVQAADVGYALHGDQDDAPDQYRVWFTNTLADAQLAAASPGTVGHLLPSGRYIESLTDRTQLYASPGCSIQAAIDASSTGDTITVTAGIYYENVDLNTPGIYLWTNDDAVIDGGVAANAVTVTEDGSTIYGFVIQNGDDDGVSLVGVEQVKVDDNEVAGALAGIYLEESHWNDISGNYLHDNTWVGVQLYLSDFNTVSGNTVIGTMMGPDPHVGIHLMGSSGNEISDNTVETSDNGIYLGLDSTWTIGSIGNVVKGNTVEGCEVGIGIEGSDGNQVVDNQVIGSTMLGIGVAFSSGTLISGNTIDNALGATMPGIYLILANDTTIERNVITTEDAGGVYDLAGTGNEAHWNSLAGSPSNLGVLASGDPLDATLNWWGSLDGPTFDENMDWAPEYDGGGTRAEGSVIFSPWLGIDPDSEGGTVGVQLESPMLIVVDDVGPEPAGGYLGTAIAAANGADLSGFDTIEVRHGTYDASEPITDSVEIVSEVGSAAHTTLTGPVEIRAADVLLGKMRQGFTITGAIRVGAGVDATTVHINWNDLYNLLTNHGDGVLDATFNYWGRGSGTVGLVDVTPMLPEGSDKIVGYMDAHGLSAVSAIDFSYLLRSLSEDKALQALGLMRVFGFSRAEAIRLIREYGAKAEWAMNASGGNYDAFLIGLLGYGSGGGGGGGLLGGGGGGTVGDDGLPTFLPGDTVPLEVQFFHPVTGEVLDDLTVDYTIVRTLEDGTPEIVAFGVMAFNAETQAYTFNFDTAGLEPGVYDVYIGAAGGGPGEHMVIRIAE